MALVSVALAMAAPLHGAFDQFGKDARPSGMGEAFVGVADDVSALYYNPAGLSQIQGLALSTQFSQIVDGLDDDSRVKTNSLGFVQSMKGGQWGTVGFSYVNYAASSLASERLFLAGYARRVSLERWGWDGDWSVGGNIKNMRREYEADRFADNALNNVGVGSGQADPLFAKNGLSKDVFAVDIGALYRFGPSTKYSFGFSVANLNRPDVSLEESGDHAPMTSRLGFAVRPSWGLLSTELRRTKRLSSGQDSEVAVGVERVFSLVGSGNMAVRGGYVKGSRNASSATAGLSFRVNSVRLDYGFIFPLGELTEAGGLHRAGLSLQFGRDQNRIAGASIQTHSACRSGDSYCSDHGEDKDKAGSKIALVDFSNSFRSAHFILDRLSVTYNLTAEERDRFVGLLVKKYTEGSEGPQDWELIKKTLWSGVSGEDTGFALASLEYWLIGNEPYALTFLGLLSPESKESSAVLILTAISLTELAAKAYQKDEMEICLEKLREVVALARQDEKVSRVYQQLFQRYSIKLAAARQ